MVILSEMTTQGCITNRDFMFISRALESKDDSEEVCAMFYAIPSELRMEWLSDENLLE
jgi:hypothetical protein